MPFEFDPRDCRVRVRRDVAEVPDADGAVEGGGEDDVLGQRVELDQLQAKGPKVNTGPFFFNANIFGNPETQILLANEVLCIKKVSLCGKNTLDTKTCQVFNPYISGPMHNS